MRVCPTCGNAIEEFGYLVVRAGVEGVFDSCDCLDHAERRQQARRHLIALVDPDQAAILSGEDDVPLSFFGTGHSSERVDELVDECSLGR